MKKDKKWNKMFLLAMLAATLVFGLVLVGCATWYQVAPETVVEEVITLESTDVKALAAERGYTEDAPQLYDNRASVSPLKYPQAGVKRFTAATKQDGIEREFIVIATETRGQKWRVRQQVTGKDGKVTVLSAAVWDYPTEAEANAGMQRIKEEHNDPIVNQTLVVIPMEDNQTYSYTGMKPLQ